MRRWRNAGIVFRGVFLRRLSSGCVRTVCARQGTPLKTMFEQFTSWENMSLDLPKSLPTKFGRIASVALAPLDRINVGDGAYHLNILHTNRHPNMHTMQLLLMFIGTCLTEHTRTRVTLPPIISRKPSIACGVLHSVLTTAVVRFSLTP